MGKKITTNDFKKSAKLVHGELYGYDKAVYIKAKDKVKIYCKKCKKYFDQQAKHHTNGSGCSVCAISNLGKDRRLTTEQFIEKANKVHLDVYTYQDTKYYNSRTKVIITCKVHKNFDQLPNAHLNSQGCPKCYGTLKHTTESFIVESKGIHGDKYNYDKVVYVNMGTKVSIYCKKHQEYFDQTPLAHIHNSQDCPKCGKESMAKTQSSTKEEFLTKAKEVHGDLYDYSEVDYKNSNKIPVTIICKTHGPFSQRPDNHLGKTAGCMKCNNSKGEIKVANYLKLLKIVSIEQYMLPNSKFRYDFYLPELNILIEYDGIQHFRPVEYWGGVVGFNKQKDRDNLKNSLAKLNGISIIRIPYTEFNNIEDLILFKISKIYKYRIGNIFYRNFLELCNSLKLPVTTKPKDVKRHLTFNNTIRSFT